MHQVNPLTTNPSLQRSSTDGLEVLKADIQLGMELVNSPSIIKYLEDEYQQLVYNVSHLQPSTETDRDLALVLNTMNAKIAVLEKLHNFASRLPEAMEAYKAMTNPTEE